MHRSGVVLAIAGGMTRRALDLEPIDHLAEVLASENDRRRRSRWVWISLLVLALAVLGWFLARGRVAAGPTYEFTELERRDLEVTVTAVGTIELLDEVDVGSELSGILRSVFVAAGDSVEQGQVLAQLDPAVLEAQSDQARAQVRAAEASVAQLDAARANARRERDLASSLAGQGAQTGDIAERAASAFEQSDAATAAASAQLRAARAVLRLAEVNLEKSTIRVNIMMVSVTERTREIGIRLAVGALGRDVLRQFLIEAVVLSVAGVVVGIAVGLLGSVAASRALDLPSVIEADVIAFAFVFSGLIGVGFGYFPARRVARLNPIDALRHEQDRRSGHPEGAGAALRAGSAGTARARPRPGAAPAP